MSAPRATISVILADDHPVVLHGVAGILRAQSDMNILAACSDGAHAVDAIRKLTPDVAVLDVVMPGLNGLDLLAAMASDGSKTRVIFLTAVATNDQILAAIANGAKGIVLKDAAPDTLVDCIRDVAAGKQWFPSDLVEAAFRHNATLRNETDRFESRLTAREQQIVLMVAEGLGNKEIARRIDLSEGTIKIHLHNIYEKLDIPNRTALTALAIAYQHRLRG